MKLPKCESIGAFIVTIIVLTMFAGIVYWLAIQAIPEANKDLFNIGFGALVAVFTQACQYWLGTSSSSPRKDMTIAELKTPIQTTTVGTSDNVNVSTGAGGPVAH